MIVWLSTVDRSGIPTVVFYLGIVTFYYPIADLCRCDCHARDCRNELHSFLPLPARGHLASTLPADKERVN